MLENDTYSLFINNVNNFEDFEDFITYFINNYDIKFVEFCKVLNKYFNKDIKKIKKYLLKLYKEDYNNIVKLISKYYKIIYESNEYSVIKNKFSFCSQNAMKNSVLEYFLTTQIDSCNNNLIIFDENIIQSYRNVKIQKPKKSSNKQSTRVNLFSTSIKNKVEYDKVNDDIIYNYEKYKRNSVQNQFQLLLTKYFNEFNLNAKNALVYVNNITNDNFTDCEFILSLSKAIFVKSEQQIDKLSLKIMSDKIHNIVYLSLYDFINPIYLHQAVDNLSKNIVELLSNCDYINPESGEKFTLDDIFYIEFPIFLKKVLCRKI